MTFRDDLGTITCRCVTERNGLVLSVSHASGERSRFPDSAEWR